MALIALMTGASLARADLVAHWKLDDNAANTTVAEEVAGMNNPFGDGRAAEKIASALLEPVSAIAVA